MDPEGYGFLTCISQTPQTPYSKASNTAEEELKRGCWGAGPRRGTLVAMVWVALVRFREPWFKLPPNQSSHITYYFLRICVFTVPCSGPTPVKYYCCFALYHPKLEMPLLDKFLGKNILMPNILFLVNSTKNLSVNSSLFISVSFSLQGTKWILFLFHAKTWECIELQYTYVCTQIHT